MKKIIKKIKSLGISGFTLIELLGVLVIMGLLILVVMPNLYKLIHKNDAKDYTTYYDLIEFGAVKYADDARSELGTTHDIGCTHISLEELVQKEYVSEFSKKGVDCSLGSHGIVIRNNNGKITVKYRMTCKKGDDVIFAEGEDDALTCLAYKGDDSISFVEKISGLTHTDKDNISYITATSNYVKFSGQLFRIVSINKTLNTVKLVSDTPVASIRYNGDERTTYTNSDIEMWLNNEYLKSLQPDYRTYLASAAWKPTSTTTRKAVVGLVSKEDYGYISGWYGSDQSWLLDEGGFTAKSPFGNPAVNSFHSVRPAITLNPDVVWHSGTGSKTDPYVISDTPIGAVDEFLNQRIPGEYVKFSGSKYRIVSVNAEGTKLIGTASIGKKKFADELGEGALNYLIDSSNLGIYLNDGWITSLSGGEKNLLDKGDFCLDTINSTVTTRLSTTCIDDTLIKSMKVGAPKIGELFTGPYAGINYWTVNPNTIRNDGGTYTNSTINVVKSDGTIAGVNIKDQSTDVVVVIYLGSNVQINGGSGTEASPYTIK